MTKRKIGGTRTKICSLCNNNFTYEVSRGNDRIYCKSEDCQLKRKVICRADRIKAYPPCKACGNKPGSRVASGLCETCYYRKRRNGHTNPTIKFKHSNALGYVVITNKKDHPLARNKTGYIFEHRLVAFDNYGESPHDCYWCGNSLATWDDITVDHLNSVKFDNRKENLVLACCECNRYRGRINAMTNRILPKRLDELKKWIGQNLHI